MTLMNFPPPKDPEEFERLLEQVAGPVLRSRQVNINGRRGQAQHGVDISVATEDGETVGIQCKLVQTLTLKVVDAEVVKAGDYLPALDLLVIATSAPSDAKLQEKVRLLTAPFRVIVWSWDEINNHINRLPGLALDYVQHVLMGGMQEAEGETPFTFAKRWIGRHFCTARMRNVSFAHKLRH